MEFVMSGSGGYCSAMDVWSSLFSFPGYAYLFVLSFLASTVLPVGSEWMLILMVGKGYAPETCVLVAGVGNYLGACTTLALGRWGSDYITRRFLRMDERQVERAKRLYRRLGSWSLLFSWLPVVGDPLCLAAGIFRVPFLWFSLLVLSGKCARYAVLAWAVPLF